MSVACVSAGAGTPADADRASLRERWISTLVGIGLFLGLLALVSWPFALIVGVGALVLWGGAWVVFVGGLSLVIKVIDWVIVILEWAFEHHPAVMAARAEAAACDAEIADGAKVRRALNPAGYAEWEERWRKESAYWVEVMEAEVAEGTRQPDDESLAEWRNSLAEHEREIAELHVRAKELAAKQLADKRRHKKRLEAQRRRRRARTREKRRAERALERVKLQQAKIARVEAGRAKEAST